MNQAPTLGKIRKDIDSHFHGNDRRDKKGEEMCDMRDGSLFHRYIIDVMVE